MISGFRASDIGQYGIGDLTFWTDPIISLGWFDVPVPMGATFDIWHPWRDPPARSSLPSVGVLAPYGAEAELPPQIAGPEALPSQVVIDPDFRPTATVYEDAPGGIYETNRKPTDWGAYYERYEEINRGEDDEVIDWGELAGSIIGGIWDPFGAGAAVQTAFSPPGVVAGMGTVPNMGGPVATGITGGAVAGCGPTGPKYGKICLATGVVTPLRRRRRRRLLTSSDIKDLSALKSIVGGAALQGAVVQAVRR